MKKLESKSIRINFIWKTKESCTSTKYSIIAVKLIQNKRRAL